MQKLSMVCALSLLCLFAPRLEADIIKQFPLPGTFNLQQTVKVVGEKQTYKSRARAVIKKQRDGSLTVVTKRKGRRRMVHCPKGDLPAVGALPDHLQQTEGGEHRAVDD
jgi:hypothetical protein